MPPTQFGTPANRCPVGYGSPLTLDDGPRVPLYTEDFAKNPAAAYAQMREDFGQLAPVWLAPGVPATLVVGYYPALAILFDRARWPVSPQEWQRSIPPDSPVRPMMEGRQNALRTDGDEHARFREANVDSLKAVAPVAIRAVVVGASGRRIKGFRGRGTAELLADFAVPLVFEVMCELIGCFPDIAQRASAGMALVFDTTSDAAEGNRQVMEALSDLVTRKRANPGPDVTSSLLNHPANLTDDEVVNQLFCLFAAATEPLSNLIVNTVLFMLTHPGFGEGVMGGAISTREALSHVLLRDPPLANFCFSYPRRTQALDIHHRGITRTVLLPAHQPVVISLAACNNDPDVMGERSDDAYLVGNESHLSFGAGPHRCPARSLIELVASLAIDLLLDAVPDLSLSVGPDELTWRPGPFHRSLVALPVSFTPVAA